MPGLAVPSTFKLNAPKALSYHDVQEVPEYQVVEPEPRDPTPHELLAAAVVQRALLDAERGLRQARVWLLEEFPHSVWALALPATTPARVRRRLAALAAPCGS